MVENLQAMSTSYKHLIKHEQVSGKEEDGKLKY